MCRILGFLCAACMAFRMPTRFSCCVVKLSKSRHHYVAWVLLTLRAYAAQPRQGLQEQQCQGSNVLQQPWLDCMPTPLFESVLSSVFSIVISWHFSKRLLLHLFLSLFADFVTLCNLHVINMDVVQTNVSISLCGEAAKDIELSPDWSRAGYDLLLIHKTSDSTPLRVLKSII